MINEIVAKKVLRAFESKDISVIRRAVVEEQVNPNALIPNKGVCLLHLIIGHPSESFAYNITKLFLSCGGDPNVQSSDGVTPTHVAAGWGRNRILHLLLVHGGDPWIQDEDKRNSFNYAFEEQEWSTIELLHHFQQMHAASNSKANTGNENIRLQLEKILVKKSEGILSCSPVTHSNKSIMTESPSQVWNTPISPIQNKIKYFEPKHEPLSDNGVWRIPDKPSQMGWSKGIYEASKVIICDDCIKTTEEVMEKKTSFVSSLHVSTFPKETSKSTFKLKEVESSTPKDVRGQLFVELQEAVRRRSKQKICDECQDDSEDTRPAEDPNSDSIVVLKESFTTEKQIYSSPLNLSGSNTTKNTFHIATQVADDIKTSKTGEEAETTVDLCSSSLESTDDGADPQSSSAKVQTLVLPQSGVNNSTVYLTPLNWTSNDDLPGDMSKGEGSNASFISFPEDYGCTEPEDDNACNEKKLGVTPVVSLTVNADEVVANVREKNEDVASFSSSSTSCSYNSDVLRSELLSFNQNVGPITKTTKKLYLKKLKRIQRDGNALMQPSNGEHSAVESVHSPTLKKTLREGMKLKEIQKYKSLEEEMCQSFGVWTKQQWREGKNKTSFNYLLLDPRRSLNLPKRVDKMTEYEAWKCFLSAIFYIGKGKRCRPYAHLYQAAAFWRDRKKDADEKVALITDIWREGLGVVCLQVFQNVMPVEAYTREAAMIDALDLTNLKNVKKGEYYGVVSTWSLRDKQKLGVYLLYKAYLIFLNEGEKQIKPYDL